MVTKIYPITTTLFVNDDQEVSLADLCLGCELPAEQILTMIENGIIEPLEPSLTSSCWQFSIESVIRLKTATRLQRDLDVNVAGAALALDLLDEVKNLRQLVEVLRRE